MASARQGAAGGDGKASSTSDVRYDCEGGFAGEHGFVPNVKYAGRFTRTLQRQKRVISVLEDMMSD